MPNPEETRNLNTSETSVYDLQWVEGLRGWSKRVTLRAAANAAPEEMPTSRPSSRDSLLAMSRASLLCTVIIRSSIGMSKSSGIIPAPIPCI